MHFKFAYVLKRSIATEDSSLCELNADESTECERQIASRAYGALLVTKINFLSHTQISLSRTEIRMLISCRNKNAYLVPK